MTDYFPCPRKHTQGVPYTPAVSMPSSSARPGSTLFCKFMGTEVHRLGDGFVFSGPSLADSQRLADQFFKAYPHLKDMLIYGQKPSSPPPATLTQEQLARDAGQLVEAHVLLDKLCDDTDRSQHSLVHRLKQIVYGSEEMNKVLEKAGFNTAAGLLECVKAMAQRQKTTKETLDQVEARALGYQLEITRLKDRNKRLHDAQGSGTAEAAKLQKVRDTLSKLTSPNARGVVGMAEDAVTMNLNQQHEIVRLRAEAGKDPALERMVQEAHRLMHKAGVSPLSGTLLERVGNLVDECARLKICIDPRLRDKVQAAHLKLNTVEQVSTFGTIDKRVASLVDLFKARVASVPLYAIPSVKLVDECVRLLDKAAIPSGNLDERVAALVRRCEHHASHYQAAVKDVGDLSNQLAAAKSINVPPEYDKRYHEKLNELPEIERTGTLLERVTQTVERLKLYQPILDSCRAHLAQACRTLGVANIEGTTTEGMAMKVNEEVARMRAAHKVAPDAAHCVNVVEECVRKLNEANIICVPLPDRIQHLLDERAAVRRDLLNLAAVTATADSNRTLAARAVNRVTTMEKTIVAFANSPSVKELL